MLKNSVILEEYINKNKQEISFLQYMKADQKVTFVNLFVLDYIQNSTLHIKDCSPY